MSRAILMEVISSFDHVMMSQVRTNYLRKDVLRGLLRESKANRSMPAKEARSWSLIQSNGVSYQQTSQ